MGGGRAMISAAAAHTGDYVSHGLRINSEIALPELDTTRSARAALPEVSVRIGHVEETLPGATRVASVFQFAERDMLFEFPGIARYRVRHGEEIVVDPFADASAKAIRLHVLGTALSMLCLQRGLLPLHANAIVASGRAIGFAGRSGAGKSTLTATLRKRGYAVLSDDVCVVSFDDEGRALCWPGIPRLKLWREAAAALGQDISRCETLLEGIDKYHVPLSDEVPSHPLPFDRLYVLPDRGTKPRTQIDRLVGGSAVKAIMENTYRGWAAVPMRMADVHFRLATAFARSAEVFAVGRQWGFDVYEDEVDRLECHVMR
jgi:hypothetical protein